MYPVGLAENCFFCIPHYWKASIVPLLLSSIRTACVKNLKSLFTDYLHIQDTSVAGTNQCGLQVFVGNACLSLLFGTSCCWHKQHLKSIISVLHFSSFCQLKSCVGLKHQFVDNSSQTKVNEYATSAKLSFKRVIKNFW